MTEKEELKPCPFCGDTVVKQTDLDGRLKIWCRAHTHIGFTLTQDHKQSIRKWNNAYCWKELSRAKKEAEEKDKEIRRLQTDLSIVGQYCLERHVEVEWKQWAEKLNDTLEDMWNQFAYRGKKNGKEILVNGGLSALEGCQESLSDFQKFKESQGSKEK